MGLSAAHKRDGLQSRRRPSPYTGPLKIRRFAGRDSVHDKDGPQKLALHEQPRLTEGATVETGHPALQRHHRTRPRNSQHTGGCLQQIGEKGTQRQHTPYHGVKMLSDIAEANTEIPRMAMRT